MAEDRPPEPPDPQGALSKMSTPQPCPSQAPPIKYWEKAFSGLDDKVKERIKKLMKTFDNDTEKALQRLASKKTDAETVEKLKELNQFYRHLSIQRKGDIQRLDMSSNKRLDNETVKSISDIADEARRSSVDVNRGNGLESLDELLKLCQERQSLSSKKKHNFKLLGKPYSAHDLWVKIISRLDALKSPIDVAIQADPTAGLVWSVVKVFLEFAILVENVASSILTGIEIALGAIQRGSIYEQQIRAIQHDPASHSHVSTFGSVLISLYTRIFGFFSKAALTLENNGISYWRACWEHDDIANFETGMMKDEEALHHNSFLSATIVQDDKLKEITRILLEWSERSENREKLKQRRHIIRSREDTLGWLSCLPVKDYHTEVYERRAENTGDWIFKREEYTQLIEGDGPSLLWIKGIPGAGKTMLISHIIEHYLEQQGSRGAATQNQKDTDTTPIDDSRENDAAGNFQIAYFYCKRDVANRRNSESIFSSFIKQLAVKYYPIPESIQALYEEKLNPEFFSIQVGSKRYQEILEGLIPRTTDTFLILDALDECVEDSDHCADDIVRKDDMNKVLETFGYLLRSGLPVKIIVTSRYDETIEASLSDKFHIEISSNDNWEDISAMIKSRIQHHRKLEMKKRAPGEEPLINKALRIEIMEEFKKKSKGMFQWASLHINYLLTLSRRSDIQCQLKKLPPSLKIAYDDIFRRIRLQTDIKAHMALRVFRWLLACEGSVDKQVLLAATSQTLRQSNANEVYRDIDYVLTVCQNLVITEGNLIRFSHLSVQEYCAEHQEDLMKDCHLEVVKVCTWILFCHDNKDLAYDYWMENRVDDAEYRKISRKPHFRSWGWEADRRNNPDFDVELMLTPPHRNELYKLWFFAYGNWHNHFDKIKNENQKADIGRSINNCISDSSPIFKLWILLRVADLILVPPHTMHSIVDSAQRLDTWIRTIDRSNKPKPRLIGSLLVTQAVLAGLCWNIRKGFGNYLDGTHQPGRFIEESQWPQQTDLYFMEDQEMPYEVDTQENEVKVLGMILSDCHIMRHPAARNVVTARNRLVSMKRIFEKAKWPSHRCYEELARLLLLLLCQNNQQWKDDEVEFAHLLLSQYPRAPEISYQYLIVPTAFLDLSQPLLRAVEYLEPVFVQLLVGHGAPIDFQNGYRDTPLTTAISQGKFDSAKILLESGANVNFQTPLIAACSNDDIRFLALLLDHPDIRVNEIASTGRYATALIAACANCHIAAVQALLKRHVSINTTTRTGIYGTALSAAADMACLRIVRLLMRYGAKPVPTASEHRREFVDSKEQDPDLKRIRKIGWQLMVQLLLDSVRGKGTGFIFQRDKNGYGSGAFADDKNKSNHGNNDDLDLWSDEEEGSNEDSRDKDGGNGADVKSTTYELGHNGYVMDGTANISNIIRKFNVEIRLSSRRATKSLAEEFGFINHKHETALWKGIENLLKVTDGKDWEMVRNLWIKFIDLAEDCDSENKGLRDMDVERLADGGLVPLDLNSPNLSRQESGFDCEPYETELDSNCSISEGELDEDSEEAH